MNTLTSGQFVMKMLSTHRPKRNAMIAAIAIEHGLPVATRSIANFEGTGVRWVNPWDA